MNLASDLQVGDAHGGPVKYEVIPCNYPVKVHVLGKAI